MLSNNHTELFAKLNKFVTKYYLNKLVQGGIYFFAILFIFFIGFSALEYFGKLGVGGRTFLCWSYIIISGILVVNHNNTLVQQILFLLSSIIIIISPIIFSLGYFIYFQPLIHIEFVKFIIVILINAIFLLPFAILILFTKLKNIYINFDDIKKTFRISEKNFIKIIYPLIQKNLIYIFSFSAAISFGDFTIISFFKNESFQTLPTILYKLITSYRFNEASFVAGFMLIFSLLIYLLFDNSFYKDNPVNNK